MQTDHTRSRPAGRFIDVGAGTLYAHVHDGDEPTLIFLHYWGGSHRTWTPVIERISPRHSVIAYDQRGWGASRSLPGPFTLDGLADDAQRVIDTVQSNNYVLVGHSMGGKIAQLVSARRPAGLTGVVLVAPAPPEPADVTPAQQEALGHAYDSADPVNQSIDHALTKNGLDPALRAQVVEDSLRSSDDARSAWPRHGLVQDITDAVTSVNVPVLVLAGSDDQVDPPGVLATHLMRYIPTATLAVLSGTGHLSPLEVPGQVAAHIDDFVSQVRR